MKKLLCVILSMLLVASLAVFTGCSEANTGDIDPVVDSSEEVTPEDEAACIEALTAIAGCQPGSAGSSMKTYMASVAFLDWSAETGMNAEQFRIILESFLDGLGSGDFEAIDLPTFFFSFEGADYIAREIIAGEYAELDGMSESTSVTPAHESYELEVYEAYSDVITAAAESIAVG